MKRVVALSLALALAIVGLVAGAKRAEACTPGTGVGWCIDPASTAPAITAGPLGLGGYGVPDIFLPAATKVWSFVESSGTAVANFGTSSVAGTALGATISTRVVPIHFSKSAGNTALAHNSLFFAATDGYAYSIDATSGACNWRTFVGRTSGPTVNAIVDRFCVTPDLANPCGDSVTAETVLDIVGGDDTTSLVYVATNDGSSNGCSATTQNRVYALNPSNGQPVWVFNRPAPADYSTTAAPNTVGQILWSPTPDTYNDYACPAYRNRNQVIFSDGTTMWGLTATTGAASWSANTSATVGTLESYIDVTGQVCGGAYVAGFNGAAASVVSLIVDPVACGGAASTPCSIGNVQSGFALPLRMTVGHSYAATSVGSGLFIANSNGTTYIANSSGACSYTPGLGSIGDPFIVGSFAYTATQQGTVLQLPLPTTTPSGTCAGAVERVISAKQSTIVGDPGADLNTATTAYIFAGDQAGRVSQLGSPFDSTTHTLWAQVTGLNQSGVTVLNGATTLATVGDNGIVTLAQATGTSTYTLTLGGSATAAGCTLSSTPLVVTLTTADQYISITCAPATTSYPIQVTVTGLGSDGSPNVTLTDTVGGKADTLFVNANGTYTFGLSVASGTAYFVTSSTATNGWSCTLGGTTSGAISGAVALTLTCGCAAATPTQCGSTCVSIGSADNKNCGGCGLYCPSSCSGGECAVQMVVLNGTNSGALVVDSSYVYYGASSLGLLKVAKNVVGGTPATSTTLFSSNQSDVGMATDGVNIWWSYANTYLYQASVTGSSLFNPLQSTSYGVGNIAIDSTSTYVYWSDFYRNRILRTVAGSNPAQTVLFENANSSSTNCAITVAGSYVYWVDTAVGTICRASAPSGAQTCTAAISTLGNSLTNDGTNVYAALSGGGANGAGSIVYIPINEVPTGGLLTTTTLATGLWNPTGLVTDGLSVYAGGATGYQSNGTGGPIQRVQIASPNTVTVLYRDNANGNPDSLAVDGLSVYWTERGGNTVLWRVTPK